MDSLDTLEATVSELTTGFDTLSAEFANLFSRQEALERQLRASQEECEQLRRLCPEANVESISSTEPSPTEAATPQRSFDELLARLSNEASTSTKVQAMSAAVTASQRWREPLGEVRKSLEATKPPAGRPTPRQGCPFAAMGGQKPADHPTTGEDQPQHEPNALDARSEITKGGTKKHKRASFNDPLETDAQSAPKAVSEVASTASGPACPIRFLDQHSAEDIAKYFEEHKHELPRSHELCVKRFQANADSIRKLDAQYGNLVTMIQGLGQKHQPMLPTNPTSEPMPVQEPGEGSDHKIKNWARAVSDQAVATPIAENDDRRMGHFDRPLKDIRVGESPSRPWGVPIPSKYLDAAEEAAPVEDEEPKEVPKGKCPFNHAAAKAMNMAPDNTPAPRLSEPERPQAVPRSPAAPYDKSSGGPVIVNHGSTFVAAGQDVSGIAQIVNHGTVLLGVDDDLVKFYLNKIFQSKDGPAQAAQ